MRFMVWGDQPGTSQTLLLSNIDLQWMRMLTRAVCVYGLHLLLFVGLAMICSSKVEFRGSDALQYWCRWKCSPLKQSTACGLKFMKGIGEYTGESALAAATDQRLRA
jgi:hypothetical protein